MLPSPRNPFYHQTTPNRYLRMSLALTNDNINISEEEVYAILRKLQTDKAAGPDGVSNKLLKITARSITPSLTMLFNKVITKCVFPKIWKETNITPIFKKGDRDDKRNYHPVSLLSTVGKVLERIIFNQLYSYCENHGHLTWRNSGYKKRDSTVNQLTYIVNNIYNNLEKNEETSLVFLDQSKAFDRIFPDGVKHKLRNIGSQRSCFQLVQLPGETSSSSGAKRTKIKIVQNHSRCAPRINTGPAPFPHLHQRHS